ncbi:MAG: 6-phosphofructokinase [Helicobacteraceae bacterium]|nr:6-phosphofructokinase [Helicobacteraceae bacterium]
MKNIAILCSGGDVSGMNPAIKHFVEYSIEKGLQPYFVYDGFEGLIDNNIVSASYKDVSGIITRGGTKIGSARSKRFLEASYRQIAKDNLDKHGIDKLVVLGGDGSFRGMAKFYEEHGIAFAGIPSTIDNDIVGTDYCLGVDTALNIIREALDAVRDTASSFKRAFVVETMGRDCGYLALVSGLTSGAELTLIPEVSYNLHDYEAKFKKELSEGRRYFLAVISEGIKESAEEVAAWFEDVIGIESRATVLGHIQRGGNPTSRDRLMAYRFINFGIDGLLAGKNDKVSCYSASQFNYKSIGDVANTQHVIEPALMKLAESCLTC